MLHMTMGHLVYFLWQPMFIWAFAGGCPLNCPPYIYIRSGKIINNDLIEDDILFCQPEETLLFILSSKDKNW